MPKLELRCGFPAWIAGWVTAIFLPSILIAYAGLSAPASAIGQGFEKLPATAWKVADDVGPAAKLILGGLLGLLFFAAERLRARRALTRYIASIVGGLIAVPATLLLVPSEYSRGFGVGLTGARFDAATLPLYLIGGATAGLIFTWALARCQRKTLQTTPTL